MATKASAGLIGNTGKSGTPAPTTWKGYAGATAASKAATKNDPTVAAPAPAAPTPAPSPFLTAAQQAAWSNYQLAANNDLTADTTALNNAPAQEAANEAIQQHNAAVSAANAQAMAAARGIMGSGINASNLADINTTLANNIHTLQTNLGSLQTELQGKISTTQTDLTNEQGQYWNDAVANAAGETPTTPTAAAPPASTTTTTDPTAGTTADPTVGTGIRNVIKAAPTPTIKLGNVAGVSNKVSIPGGNPTVSALAKNAASKVGIGPASAPRGW